MIIVSNRNIVGLGLALVVGGAVGALEGRQLASRSTAEWIATLEAPARLASLRIDDVIARMTLNPGDVVADLGAGAGAFSVPIARAVGPKGKVYAVDIDRGLVDHIGRKATSAQLSHLTPILGTFTDPTLPAADVDVALFHDVLHHIEDRATYLVNSAKYLKRGGRAVVVEFDGPNGPHSAQQSLQVTRDMVGAWMRAAGLTFVEELPFFDHKWIVVYQKK
jgi:ubiquinone/menaquinone biosynthesis C-methylase UbiE